MPPDGFPANTNSVIVRDPETGQLGAAVQSHWFSVGSLVPWAEPGVGAVVTQSFVEASYGPRGLARMRKGVSPQRALQDLLARDRRREWRQVAMVDSRGAVAAHTGSRCVSVAGHLLGKQWSVQANMMVNDRVIPAMASAMTQSRGELAARLISALEAGENAGGDIRGAQSAAILIVSGGRTRRTWEGRILDLRVEDHRNPIKELRRLIDLQRAYGHMSLGVKALVEGDLRTAIDQSRISRTLSKGKIELALWHAVACIRSGDLRGAAPILKRVFHSEPRWREYCSRLAVAGLLRRSELALVLKLVDGVSEAPRKAR